MSRPRDLDANLADPADWAPTRIPALVALDASLRCEICKDFYTAPVITSCGHTFCSLCIRRCLGADGKCATCRAPEQESRLRKNGAVAQAVDAFVTVRERLLQVAETAEDTDEDTEEAVGNVQASEEREDGIEEVEMSTDSQRPRRRTRKKRIDYDEDDEEEYRPVTREEEAPPPRRSLRERPPDDGLVACPICNRRMKEAQVSLHIDDCLAGKPFTAPPATPGPASPHKQSAIPNVFPSNSAPPSRAGVRQIRSHPSQPSGFLPHSSGPPIGPTLHFQPLPKITYSLYTDSKLRSKLKELGIRADGPKKLMQERHTEWLNLWNANVDSAKPRTKRQLLDDLDAWERAHVRPPNNKTKAPEWSDEKWQERHADTFADLIAKARGSIKKKRKVGSNEDESRNDTEQVFYESGNEEVQFEQERVGRSSSDPQIRATNSAPAEITPSCLSSQAHSSQILRERSQPPLRESQGETTQCFTNHPASSQRSPTSAHATMGTPTSTYPATKPYAPDRMPAEKRKYEAIVDEIPWSGRIG